MSEHKKGSNDNEKIKYVVVWSAELRVARLNGRNPAQTDDTVICLQQGSFIP